MVPEILFISAMSVLATLLVFIYRNLYFDLNVIFVLSYLLKDIFTERNLWFPLILLILLLPAYGGFAQYNWLDVTLGGDAS
jgi:hypothetical protein